MSFMKTEERSRSETHITPKNCKHDLFAHSLLLASSANNYTLLPEQAPAAFLLLSVCTLLDTVIVVEEEEEFVNADFDLSEVFPRI